LKIFIRLIITYYYHAVFLMPEFLFSTGQARLVAPGRHCGVV
jgi:hypothetical protein